jgi:hypothetical protein
MVQIRYTVHMDVQLGSKVFNTEFTLTNRDGMKFSVLLGRRFLRNYFIVDVSNKYTQILAG